MDQGHARWGLEFVVIFARIQTVAVVLALVACQGLFEDRDSSDLCDGADCSGHGECVLVDEGTRAACVCDDDFEDDGLECLAEGAGGDADVDADDEPCIPDCETRVCGSDGCGGSCPPGCSPANICNEMVGRCECRPVCDGRECGHNGCGDWCPPGCIEGEICSDGFCTDDCEQNQGWGASCHDVATCDDGSPCLAFMGLGPFGTICMPECSENEDCPDISPSAEVCVDGGCIIECLSSADCPCWMECREVYGLLMFCYP